MICLRKCGKNILWNIVDNNSIFEETDSESVMGVGVLLLQRSNTEQPPAASRSICRYDGYK